jgi:hypothetical protein
MDEDPSYLSHLGEFGTLKNVIACWFYQGALDSGAGLPEVFADIRASHDPDSLRLLAAQLRQLLERPAAEMETLWAAQSGYGFLNPGGSREFFQLFLEAVEDPGHVA